MLRYSLFERCTGFLQPIMPEGQEQSFEKELGLAFFVSTEVLFPPSDKLPKMGLKISWAKGVHHGIKLGHAADSRRTLHGMAAGAD